MVRAGIQFPVVEAGAHRSFRLLPKNGEGVIADIGFEYMAPHRRQPSFRRRCQRDAAAFATVIGKLDVGTKTQTAVARFIAIEGGAGIAALTVAALRFIARRRDLVALVDPDGMQHAAAIEGQRLEAVSDHLAVLMHRKRRGKAFSAVVGTQHADFAGIGFGQRLRVGNHNPILRPEGNLGPVLAIGCHLVAADVEQARIVPLEAEVRARLDKQPAVSIQPDQPQQPGRRNRGAHRQARPDSECRLGPGLWRTSSMVAVPLLGGKPSRPGEDHCRNEASHHEDSRVANRVRGRPGDKVGAAPVPPALSA